MSQVNRNLSYLTVVDGETPWERLRVIRNFLEDREQADKLAALGLEKAEALDKDSFEYREHLIMLPQMLGNIDDCKREIIFLKELEAKLIPMAEAVRVEGFTDEAMYEYNYTAEFNAMMALEVRSELMATGFISKPTMRSLLQNPNAMTHVITLGLIPKEAATSLGALPKPLLEIGNNQ